MKRILSYLLIIAMLITMAPITYGADDGNISLEIKRDLATNGIYLRANMAHNGQTMILAQYRKDTLIWLTVNPVDNVEGYSCDSEICTDYEPADIFKGFLWDEMDDVTNAVVFQANKIEAPALWLDAADVGTVTLSAAGKVSRWADKSGNDRDVYQQNEANQPVYVAGKYIETDGTATYLENRSPFIAKNSYTMFVMADLDSLSGGSAQYIAEGSTTSNTPSYSFYCDNTTGSGGLFGRGSKSSNNFRVTFGEGYWTTGKQLHIYTDSKNSFSSTVYRGNRNTTIPPTAYSNKITDSISIDIFSIGARRHYNNTLTTSYFAPAKFRELLIYEGVLDDNKKQEIQDYLLNKWQLTPAVSDGSDAETGLTADALTAVSIDPDGETDTQKAYYYVPSAALDDTQEPVPLVVGLHSWSASYSDSSSRDKIYKLAKEYGWAMIHPDFRGANDNPDACASELAVGDVVRAVEFMQANANIDASRIYLVGASGGGHMALSVASRRPDIWAAVSAWVPITDLAEWYNFSKSKSSKYYSMIAACCGGAPGASDEVDAEYYLRSPINHLHNAINLPLDINTGIHDGHTGSVPISHSLNAFNVLANANGNTDKMLTDEQIAYMVDNEAIPEGLKTETVDLTAEGRSYAVHFRRTAGNARITVFEGGHTMEFGAAFKYFEDKVKTE